MQVFMYVNQNKQLIRNFVNTNGKIEAIKALRTMFNINGDFRTSVDLFQQGCGTNPESNPLGVLEAKLLIEAALYEQN